MISVVPCDDTRLPSQTILDLSLGRRFSLGERATFSVDAQLLNALNEDAVTFYSYEYPRPILGIGAEPEANGWVFPRRRRLRAKLEF